ncbi:MAG TPA: DUF3662 domain-containing protein [Peptococcaceae bacterium]|nr:DUF3662 domain-containing protein [Peptococcaceae bacterium]
MNLLTKVELVAEFIVTFLFRKRAGTIQPVEVARELIRAMLKNKQVSISNVYVPNVYRVYLHPTDLAVFESFGETFLIELAKHIYDEGSKQGYTFLTLPVVEIKKGEDMEQGSVNIKIEFNHSIVANWQIEEEKVPRDAEELEKTTVLVDSVRFASSLAKEDSRKICPYLEIIKGPDQGKIFYLDQDEFIIGRNADCDLRVQDLEISRHHLRLFTENHRWFVQDLGSTNGTYVNKLRVDRYMINPGDKIKAGQTLFCFNVEK